MSFYCKLKPTNTFFKKEKKNIFNNQGINNKFTYSKKYNEKIYFNNENSVALKMAQSTNM